MGKKRINCVILGSLLILMSISAHTFLLEQDFLIGNEICQRFISYLTDHRVLTPSNSLWSVFPLGSTVVFYEPTEREKITLLLDKIPQGNSGGYYENCVVTNEGVEIKFTDGYKQFAELLHGFTKEYPINKQSVTTVIINNAIASLSQSQLQLEVHSYLSPPHAWRFILALIGLPLRAIISYLVLLNTLYAKILLAFVGVAGSALSAFGLLNRPKE